MTSIFFFVFEQRKKNKFRQVRTSLDSTRSLMSGTIFSSKFGGFFFVFRSIFVEILVFEGENFGFGSRNFGFLINGVEFGQTFWFLKVEVLVFWCSGRILSKFWFLKVTILVLEVEILVFEGENFDFQSRNFGFFDYWSRILSKFWFFKVEILVIGYLGQHFQFLSNKLVKIVLF